MSDASQGKGWWQASDDKWYPPEQHQDDRPPPPPTAGSSSSPQSAPLTGSDSRVIQLQSGRMTRLRWINVAALIGGAVGLLMAWGTAFIVSVNGLDTSDGKVFGAVLVIAALFLWWHVMRTNRLNGSLLSVAWLALLAIAVYEIVHISSSRVVSVGSGLYVDAATAAVGMVTAVMDTRRNWSQAANSGTGPAMTEPGEAPPTLPPITNAVPAVSSEPTAEVSAAEQATEVIQPTFLDLDAERAEPTPFLPEATHAGGPTVAGRSIYKRWWLWAACGLVIVLVVVLVNVTSSKKTTAASSSSLSVGSSKSGTRPAPTTATQSPAPNVQPLLLSISDLPSGWSVDNTPQSASTSCYTNPLAQVTSKSYAHIYFAQGGSLPALAEELGYYASGPSSFATISNTLNKCKTFTETGNGQVITGSMGPMSSPTYGDQSAAYDATLTIQGLT